MAEKEKYTFGIETFGDIGFNEDGTQLDAGQSLRQLIEEAKLADNLGIDVIGLGEHHRSEYAVSSPEIVLAAIAEVTQNIKLSTAVTVLSSDDPVRVFERFSTLHALSGGREQVMLGRGSFTESFPLFGFNMEDYDNLFEEKIAMWQELLKGEAMNWNGKLTQKLTDTTVYPQLPAGETIDTIVGVGGSPDSIVRAVYYGYPVILAIIGGEPSRFKPYVELYKKASDQFKKPLQPLGMHSHGIILEDGEEAKRVGWEYIKASMDRIGADRGWAPMSRDRFEFEVDQGSYYVGTPEEVAQKIAKNMKDLGMNRFDLVYGTGGQLLHQRTETIRLYGEKVVPRVKELLGGE